MLQRLEELLGQKLTSEGDGTKLKEFSDAEMARIQTIVRDPLIAHSACYQSPTMRAR